MNGVLVVGVCVAVIAVINAFVVWSAQSIYQVARRDTRRRIITK